MEQQTGSTLVEHLVTLFIFSLSVLGLLKAQALALAHYQFGYQQLISVYQHHEGLERAYATARNMHEI